MFTFNEKVVWVTGSSTGIGRAIAINFAEHGANVIVHGNSNKEEAEKTLEAVKKKGRNRFWSWVMLQTESKSIK